MKPAPFAYARPRTLDEAVALLADTASGSSRPLAGGQSLVPMLNLRLAPVDRIVDIGGLNELRRTEERGDAILYGALVTHAAFEDCAVPDGSNGLMPYVAARIAFRPVRNRGTIGGALALADPAADWLPTIVALGATMHLVGPDARRAVAAEEFFLGPYFTALGDGELLAAIEVPRLSPGARWGHAKVATKVGEYAESLAIAVVDRPRRAARLVLGAADGAPILLAEAAERALAGEPPERLRETIRRELLAAERDFAPAKLTMHTTTLERAIRDAVA